MNLLEIISVTLSLFYVGLFIYYIIGWNRVKIFESDDVESSSSVSIIIPARNEEENIAQCLNSILLQDYPNERMEIIVIDDFSDDDTKKVVRKFNDDRIQLIDLVEFVNEPLIAYKKKAIEIGIEKSKNELIITTDADCTMNAAWLRTIVSYYEHNKPKMIIGPVAFIQKNNWINTFQLLDFMGMIGVGAAGIGNQKPIMCNGANLAYTKEAFIKVNGFKGIDNIASGDDMLLMHKIHQQFPNEIHFLKNKSAIVWTSAKSSLGDFFIQRMRWASKSFNYTDKKITITLAMIFILNCLMVYNLFFDFKIFLFQFIIKSLVEFYFLQSVNKMFELKRIFWLFLPLQFLHIVYIILIGILSMLPYNYWKGRKIR